MSNPNPFARGKTFMLACSFLVIAATTASFLQLHQIYRASRTAASISERWIPSVSKSSELGASVALLRKTQFEFVVASNDGARKKIENLIDEENQNLFIHKKFMEPLLQSNDEKVLYDAFSKNLDEYVRLNAKFVEAVKAGNRDRAQAILIEESIGSYAKMMDGLRQLNAIAYGEGIARATSVSEAHRTSLGYALGLIALCGLLGSLLFYGFRRLHGASSAARSAGVLSIAKGPTPPSSGSGEGTGKKAA